MEDIQMTLVELTELEFVRETILKSNKNIQDWAYDLNVSRQTIYDWLNKDVKIRKKNIYQVAELANKEVTIHNGIVKLDNQTIPENKERRNDMSLDAQKIINNQNTQIDLMQEKIDNLEEQAQRQVFQEQLYNEFTDIDPSEQVIMDVTISFRLRGGAKRTINSIHNIELLSKRTGYSIKHLLEIAEIGKSWKLRDHPIESIISDKTIKSLNQYDKDLQHTLSKFKEFVTTGSIPFTLPINYKHATEKNKDGSPFIVNTMVHCNWNVMSGSVIVKTVFLSD